ncbi:MAG: purine-nucleoside phosphorylase [Deltaproteobacteria bacterium]|jgi:purine-nucleoside phosphorylase|nr:purine-nucleoside phosphorylase [Deltaproteobacteria bacterium]
MLKTEKVQTGANALAERLPHGFRPEIALVLGTGLGGLADELRDAVRVPYAEIPGYPLSTVSSHAGRFSFGWLGDKAVAVQEGRCHLYEGYSPEEVTRGVALLAALGADKLVITNASGSINPLFAAGGIMAITDHINFTGRSPLFGTNSFPDMSRVYDEDLLALAERKARSLNLRLERGVYLGLTGPQLETRAETRMFRAWGVDAIGMSTVLEVIMAKSLGLRILGLSALSNQNLPDCMAEATIEEVIDVAAKTAQKLRPLLRAIVAEM